MTKVPDVAPDEADPGSLSASRCRILDTAGQAPPGGRDQLGHAQVSMTQNFSFGRRIVNPAAADALDAWHEETENHG